MERHELAALVTGLGDPRLALLMGRLLRTPEPASLRAAWECPCCWLVIWEPDPTPRCGRCGFRDTSS